MTKWTIINDDYASDPSGALVRTTHRQRPWLAFARGRSSLRFRTWSEAIDFVTRVKL